MKISAISVYECCGFGYTLHEELVAAGAHSLTRGTRAARTGPTTRVLETATAPSGKSRQRLRIEHEHQTLPAGKTSWAHDEVMLEQELVTGTPPDHKEGSTRPADEDGPTGKPAKDQEKKLLKKEEKPFHAHCAMTTLIGTPAIC